MSKIFEQQFMCEFPDDDYDLYLGIWLTYHRAADLVDGHLPYNSGGGRAGKEAVLLAYDCHLHEMAPRDNTKRYQKWQSAKLEALRIVERQSPRRPWHPK